jgi:hypothetical protein
MYQFKIRKQEEGGYKFELDGIRMIIESYSIKNDQHMLTHPQRAIAYFIIEDNIYGISNDPLNYDTAEAFYDAITKQYHIFTGNNANQNALQHIA